MDIEEPGDDGTRNLTENKDENVLELPAILLREAVILPKMAVPMELGDETSQLAVRTAMLTDGRVAVVYAPEEDDSRPLEEQLHPVAVVATTQRVERMGQSILVVEGQTRADLISLVQKEPYLKVQVRPRPDPETWDEETEKLRVEVGALIETYIELSPGIPDQVSNFIRTIRNPGHMADNAGYAPELTTEQRLKILDTFDLKERLEVVRDFFRERVAYAQIQSEIREKAKEGVEQSQREYFLREQMDAIRHELGEVDETQAEIDEYRKKIQAAGMSDEAQKEALRELSRMEKMPPQAAEYSVIKTYLDWLVGLPWNKVSEDNLDIEYARKVLDEDHYDLQEVKDRILEFLAVRKLGLERGVKPSSAGDRHGAILAFVGPPGVGKTSLARSIARALGREFTRMSLGGMRDEAEIRGHRRTYVGAMPGRIIQALSRAGTRNPVFVLDEVDKVGSDWRGDPSSALLEVLDPEQNSHFRDHYLDVDFDLSQVMFITTANLLDTVPPALRDRMEVINLDGYVEPEKLQIARNYLVPRQLEENNLRPDELQFTDEAIRGIIRNYTREAGVRQLEREIGRAARKVATRIVESKLEGPVTIDEDQIAELLGKQVFYFEAAERTESPGVVIGLAVTEVGGDILFVEATRMPGNGKLILTGQLGDVMKESAEIALSYVRSRAASFGLAPDIFEKNDIHVHVPAGAVPKDGPSAGVTMVSAIVSLLTGIPSRPDVAMTGEITLRGRVLPIGGLKQKVLAAHRAGLHTVIMPKRNEADLDDLPDEVRQEMEFVPVENIDDVLRAVLPGLEIRPAEEQSEVEFEKPAADDHRAVPVGEVTL